MTLRADLAAAIARGVEAESPIAAYAALRKLDPLVRLVASRRLGKLLERARRTTIIDEPAQRLRVAALLLLAPKLELELDDAAAVHEAYAALGTHPGPARQGPWVTLAALLTLVCALSGGWFAKRALAPFDPRETEAGRALGAALGRFVTQTSYGQTGAALAETRERVVGPIAERALGTDTTNALSELMDASGWVPAAHDITSAPEVERFYGSANALAAVLRSRRLPYFVDADVLMRERGPLPLLMSFYIERESEFQAAGVTVRALDLWRLDTLGVRYGALGYTRPRTPAALVLLDQVEAELVRSVLPALAPGEPSELVDDETRERNLPWVTAVERVAGEAVRKHYVALSADPNVATVGKLLARRRTLVRRWRATIADGGSRLRVPERLIPEADYVKDLHLRIANDELYEWQDLHDDLLSKHVYAAFLRLREPYVAAIERHEVEHRLDFARGFMPVPSLLCRLLGLENPLDAPSGSIQGRASEEFSAYLAELVDSPDSPVLELVVLSEILLNARGAGGPYWYAALGLLEAVATELGIDPDQVVGHGRLERERIATLLTQVIARPPGEIRSAGARAYANAFGEPVPHVTRRSVRENAAWRH